MTPENTNLPVPAADEDLVTASRGGSLLERWIERDPDTAIKRVETMVKLLDSIRGASIKATYPPDWIIHTSVDRSTGNVSKQVGYLQDSGAERAGKVWGIELGAPIIERTEFPDGTYMYTMAAEARSKLTGERIEVVMGSRWSGDGFFQRTSRDGEAEAIDPTDVQKAAYANLHGRAVRALAGLNSVPLDMLRQNGINVDQVVFVNYDRGAKGGQATGAAVGTHEVKVGFGRSQGKTPPDLSASDLDWYLKAYGENVLDPAKAKYKRQNEQVLDALRAEKTRREQLLTQPAAAEPPSSQPAPAETEDGLRAAVWLRLVDASGPKTAYVLLESLTEELGTGVKGTRVLSEVGPDQLRKLADIPDADLRAVAKRLADKGAK